MHLIDHAALCQYLAASIDLHTVGREDVPTPVPGLTLFLAKLVPNRARAGSDLLSFWLCKGLNNYLLAKNHIPTIGIPSWLHRSICPQRRRSLRQAQPILIWG